MKDCDSRPAILVVDDERAVRETFERVLQEDYRVLLAETGQETMKILREKNVDVILLDILLPDVHGTSLLVEIKRLRPDATVVMVTALRDLETA
ncbi:MAG: response regulator, partial [Desulfobacteraceae bacterium]